MQGCLKGMQSSACLAVSYRYPYVDTYRKLYYIAMDKNESIRAAASLQQGHCCGIGPK